METKAGKNKTPIVLGILLILLGFVVNEWSVAAALVKATPVAREVRLVILAFQALLIASGVLLLKVRPRIGPRELLFIAIPMLIAAGAVEAGVRVYIKLRAANLVESFDLTGWRPKPETHWSGKVKGYGKVEFRIEKHGFRRWGDPSTTRTKVWVIGDSYTHGHTVSQGHMYYDYIAEHAPETEVFAFGGIGFGTYQEYLILDRYFDVIKPDLILWQFCQNDLVNNLYELESWSRAQNDHVIRPYYENGKVRWLYPKQTFSPVYWLARYVYTIRLVDELRDLHVALTKWTVETDLTGTHPLYMRSARKTSEIMSLVKKRIGKTPLVGFSVDDAPWSGDAFLEACELNGFSYTDEIGRRLDRLREKGEPVAGTPESKNPHWNERGHAIAGRMLLEYLRENGYLPPAAEEPVPPDSNTE